MIKIRHIGNFIKTTKLLSKKQDKIMLFLIKYAKLGKKELAAATPFLSGKTASSWDYEIVKDSTGYTIYWTNSNVNDGEPIALLIQYGHGTRNGAYVKGVDYINPAIKPVYEMMATELWGSIKNGE
ncbi:MAG: HK97 gp10 family phage protein [Eubacteriales bacterium]|nr:HK97 gp10 family phage protein [Eubacteriales bacterium]